LEIVALLDGANTAEEGSANFKKISKKFQKNFKKISKKFQKNFKKISKKLINFFEILFIARWRK
jgi:hypothetical protein